jgi:cobalt-zinc-cadmium resistance protein CzcA
MQVNYYQALKKSNLDIEKTLFDFGYGKINSFQNDNRMTVTQNIQFPAVYKSQGAINKTNINISVLSKLQKEIELKAAVKSSFFNLLLVQRRKQLLLNADSIYTSFANKAKQRFEAGNSDILEKITAESQLAQISNQLELLTIEYEVLLNEFNILTQRGARGHTNDWLTFPYFAKNSDIRIFNEMTQVSNIINHNVSMFR